MSAKTLKYDCDIQFLTLPFTTVDTLSGLEHEGIPEGSNETGKSKAATQPSPRRISPIILVIALSLLPPLDENLRELPIQLLSRFEDYIQ